MKYKKGDIVLINIYHLLAVGKILSNPRITEEAGWDSYYVKIMYPFSHKKMILHDDEIIKKISKDEILAYII